MQKQQDQQDQHALPWPEIREIANPYSRPVEKVSPLYARVGCFRQAASWSGKAAGVRILLPNRLCSVLLGRAIVVWGCARRSLRFSLAFRTQVRDVRLVLGLGPRTMTVGEKRKSEIWSAFECNLPRVGQDNIGCPAKREPSLRKMRGSACERPLSSFGAVLIDIAALSRFGREFRCGSIGHRPAKESGRK